MDEKDKEIDCEECKSSNLSAEDMVQMLVLMAFYNASEQYRKENEDIADALTEPPEPFKPMN
jgi:hypothetical protein